MDLVSLCPQPFLQLVGFLRGPLQDSRYEPSIHNTNRQEKFQDRIEKEVKEGLDEIAALHASAEAGFILAKWMYLKHLGASR